MAMGQGYNYNFRMFLEGVEVRFKSANIICTPNGVEASINLHPNEEALNLKPKTAVQIFFQDWIPGKQGEKPGWRLLFDGFFSRYDKSEQVEGGRTLAILCRDFRMDIRKFPAAIAYDSGNLNVMKDLHTAGIYHKTTIPGSEETGIPLTYSEDPASLITAADMIMRIAGVAAGPKNLRGEEKNNIKDETKSAYGIFKSSFPVKKSDQGYKTGDGGFVLDAFSKGLWAVSAGSTVMARFANKRIRADKRMFIPANESGYMMFSDQHLGKFYGQAIMGNAKFTSIEAAIMRLAGIFMTRPYSCSTPSIISLEKHINGKPNPAIEYVISENVRQFLVEKNKAEFGEPFMLNSTMLLPPMEFTAPPTFNLIFPCMYDRVSIQYDQDVDVTRGYFTQFSALDTPENENPLHGKNIQVPNTLFVFETENEKKEKVKKDIATMTIEERYKGINIMQGSIAYEFARSDESKSLHYVVLKDKAAKEANEDILKSEKGGSDLEKVNTTEEAIDIQVAKGELSAIQAEEAKALVKKQQEEQELAEVRNSLRYTGSCLENVMRRHAIFKYMNTRFAGRVAAVDMTFNPYIMCGFPGAIIADDNANSYRTQKTIIGMVQQVKHLIVAEGEASTSAILNNARFYDEPTDMNQDGSLLYMKATDPEHSEVDPVTLEHKKKLNIVLRSGEKGKSYYTKEPAAKVKQSSIADAGGTVYFKMENIKGAEDYIYAKDLLSVSEKMAKHGHTNTRFVDDIYTPYNISRFYRDVFGQKNSYMISEATIKTATAPQGNKVSFAFDSIHEGLDNLINTGREYLSDYTKAMKYIRRNICSEEEFYCLILGLSIKEVKINEETNSKETLYIVKKKKDIVKDKHHSEGYFGVSTDAYIAMIDAKKRQSEVEAHGEFSSINDGMPVTAFIKERNNAVKKYVVEANKQTSGVIYEYGY